MSKRSPSDPVSQYLSEIQRNLSSGIAREQTHRSALKDLLESLDPTIDAFNDPKHIEVGAPDFTIRRKGKAIDFPVGHVETKDVGDDLAKTEKSEQLKRYLGLPSLLLTDYLEFRWYADGKLRLSARIATLGPRNKLRPEPEGAARITELLQEFLRHSIAEIITPRDLAVRMAGIAHLIRGILLASFSREQESGRLHKQYDAFRETLIPDLTRSAKSGSRTAKAASSLPTTLTTTRKSSSPSPKLSASCAKSTTSSPAGPFPDPVAQAFLPVRA